MEALLHIYSKDNDDRLGKKKKQMEKLIKKLKLEEDEDKVEQKDLIDNKMRLYYLIREYLKETGGLENYELFTHEIVDLAFLDKVKKAQLKKGGSSD
jgi:hypothetical protein